MCHLLSPPILRRPARLQALNNWGLVLFELSGTKPPAEQRRLILQSISRFRSALRLRPEFDRAWYNLGTVFYAFASSQQASVTQRLPSSVTQVTLLQLVVCSPLLRLKP